MSNPDAPSGRLSFCELGFRGFWVAGVLLLLGVTWPVWFHWPSPDLLPRISLVPASLTGRPLGDLFAILAATVLLLSLLANGVLMIGMLQGRSKSHLIDSKDQWSRRLWVISTLAFAVHFLLDNLSLQPWAYQTFLFGLVLGFAPHHRVGCWLRVIAISIYFFSAMGKLDFQFVHTVGRDMVDAVLTALGIPLDSISENTRPKLALVFPVSELALVLVLAWKRTRKLGAVMAMAMHLTLIGLLGPWSMNHSPGVLCWNAALIGQAWWLFFRHASWSTLDRSLPKSIPKRWLAVRCVLTMLVLAPFTERMSLWDHWVSWSLYSPHTSRLAVEIHQSAITKLPQAAQKHVHPDRDGDRWRTLSMKGWALDEMLVPIYPQARYQLAVADRLASSYDLGPSIRAIEKSVSKRFDGTRVEFRMLGSDEIRKRLQYYWFSN